MKKMMVALLAGAMLIMATSAMATTFNFATGQDTVGNIQFNTGDKDANWTEVGGTNLLNGSNNMFVINGIAGWSNFNNDLARWITVNPYNQSGNGFYTATYKFDLTGYNLSTANFSGGYFSIDDNGYVALNGTTVQINENGDPDGSGWVASSAHMPFSFNTTLLLNGVNELTVVSDFSNNFNEGFRLEGKLDVAVPEPATMLLLGLGLIGVAGIRRFKK